MLSLLLWLKRIYSLWPGEGVEVDDSIKKSHWQ